jgi:tetratricopeptide (TPR) repeat protein
VTHRNEPRLQALFARLAAASSEGEATVLEQEIMVAWHAPDDEVVLPWLRIGLNAIDAQEFSAALAAFDRVVELAPDFAEGWNKRATLHCLMGDYGESVADIARTLELEPRHFGALSGLAMIREAQGRPFEALEALERVMRIHPKLPRLRDRIEKLTAQLGETI